MKFLIVILLFSNLHGLISSNRWKLTLSKAGRVEAFETRDSNFCYVMGIQNESINNTEIYLSKDQGLTWKLKSKLHHGGFLNASEDICITDTLNFFLAGPYGKLQISNDGGKSYRELKISEDNYQSVFKEIDMFNKDIGIIGIGQHYFTKNSWESFERYDYGFGFDLGKYTFSLPKFINDSILYAIAFTSKPKLFMKLNINSKTYTFDLIDSTSLFDMAVVKENFIIACGHDNTISGGSGHDVIYKSSDGGKTWRNVLDLYDDFKTNSNRTPFGLQSISFKDSFCGVAVGQFGKIIYTYDGGESWIYETNLPDTLLRSPPPTMVVKYAGSTPIIGTFTGAILTMVEDNYAPKPEDIYTITGRVWEGNKGQKNIPIAMESRVTMTDSLGYYKFTQVSPGAHTIKALNKYYDGGNPSYYYKPFLYFPEQYTVDVSSDSSNFDFNAEKTSTDIQISDSPYTISFVHNSSDITITIVNPFSNSDAEISLYTLQGSPCHTEHFQINTEMNTFIVPINNLEQGIYFATLKINNVIVKVEKIIIVK